jgi:two-component system, NarL family, sensor histidine kinase UhpB
MALALLDSAIQSLRRIIMYLTPSIFGEVGLWAALEWQAQKFQEQAGIPCTFKLHGEERALHPDRTTAVFRIVQEALTNVARHAEASETHILAKVAQQEITIRIQDNGKGVTRKQAWNSRSFGMRGMQERARAFNFSVRLSQNSGAGTTVILKIPLVYRSSEPPATKSLARLWSRHSRAHLVNEVNASTFRHLSSLLMS